MRQSANVGEAEELANTLQVIGTTPDAVELHDTSLSFRLRMVPPFYCGAPIDNLGNSVRLKQYLFTEITISLRPHNPLKQRLPHSNRSREQSFKMTTCLGGCFFLNLAHV